jgi:hypothetical protein
MELNINTPLMMEGDHELEAETSAYHLLDKWEDDDSLTGFDFEPGYSATYQIYQNSTDASNGSVKGRRSGKTRGFTWMAGTTMEEPNEMMCGRNSHHLDDNYGSVEQQQEMFGAVGGSSSIARGNEEEEGHNQFIDQFITYSASEGQRGRSTSYIAASTISEFGETSSPGNVPKHSMENSKGEGEVNQIQVEEIKEKQVENLETKPTVHNYGTPEQGFLCEICATSFATLQGVRGHQSVHFYKCKVPNCSFKIGANRHHDIE